MRLETDENIHSDVAAALRTQGHDVATIPDQRLAGHPDADVARAVQTERRCFITSGLDFADVRRSPPSQFAGLVVLHLGAPAKGHQVACRTRFFAETTDVDGRLWIVEHTRARDWTP